MNQPKKLHIELRVGETFTINGATVTLAEKSGQRARLVVLADASVAIDRPGRKAQTQPSAQECASLPTAKEHTHGKHAL